MSELDKIKARLEAAGDEEWHKYRAVGWARGMAEYAVSPGDRGQFTEAGADFILFSRADVAKLLAVVDVVRGLNTPRQVIAQWHRIADKTRPADDVLAAQFDEYAEAWEGIA